MTADRRTGGAVWSPEPMQITYRDDSGEADVDVRVRHPDATVGDLADALDPHGGSGGGRGLWIDGCPARPEQTLFDAGLRQAAMVAPATADPTPRAAADRATPPGVLALAVTGGLVAGRRHALRVGVTSVGRDPGNDVVIDHPTISGRHCTLTITQGADPVLRDEGSHNGTWVGPDAVVAPRPVPAGQPIRLGAVVVTLEPADAAPPLGLAREMTSAGTTSLNRPPRGAPPPPVTPVEPPAAPRTGAAKAPFSVVAFLAPLAFAAVMVIVLGNIRFAVFALLSPVMVLGYYLEGRRRAARDRREGDAALRVDVTRLRGEIAERHVEERARRRGLAPHPAELRQRAAVAPSRLWERRRDHADFLLLHAGIGDMAWPVPLTRPLKGVPAPAAAVIAQGATITEGPVTLDLDDGGVVGVVGERRAAVAIARQLVCQAVTSSGPADLRLVVLTQPDRAAEWDWTKWLPHTRPTPGAGGGRLVSADADDGDALLRTLLAAAPVTRGRGDEPTGPVTLLVLDADGATEGRTAPARAVLRGDAGRAAGIVVAAAADRLPSVCTAVLETLGTDGEATLHLPQRGEVVERFLAAGVTVGLARAWARDLARFDDPELSVPGAGLPDRVNLLPLLELDAVDGPAITARWKASAEDPGLAAPVGVSEDGVLTLDFVRHGPHGLLAGTTGSGKSELLRTLVTGLAATLDPEHAVFVLFDYKGGSAFDRCADLPHVVGLVTDLEEHQAQLALRQLGVELRTREQRLRSAGVTDVVEYQRLRRTDTGLPPLPRLLVVIDEFAAMQRELPDFMAALIDLAERSRSLGIHLLLATQRPTGVVSPAVRANTNLRIALRVQDETDSADVIGQPHAATIGPDAVGRGLVRLGHEQVVAFQSALVTGVSAGAGAALDVAPFRFGRTASSGPMDGAAPTDAATDLDLLAGAIAAAATASGIRPPGQLWSDEVAAEVHVDTVGLDQLLGIADMADLDPTRTWRRRSTRDALRVPVGVAADGDPLLLDLKESALGGMGPHGLVVGATGSGKSELLRTLVAALTVTHPPDRLSLVLVDFKGGATFAGMADLPHVAGMITNLADDLALVDRMRDALYGEQRRRQELLRRGGNLAGIREYTERRDAGADLEPMPSLLVVVDEFAELLTSKPDFIDLFVAIGRLGRSLGMHLLLASQRLEEGRLRGLESHLSYRIGLRTFSAAESRTVLGVPDAHTLPPEPGGGYLKVDTTVFERFKAALISGTYVPIGDGAAALDLPSGPGSTVSTLDVAVARLRDAGERVHQVWLPPLEPLFTLDQLLHDPVADEHRGLAAQGWTGSGRLAVPIGVVDRPADQDRAILTVDVSGAEGNLAIVGSPQSGKSTALRTLMAGFLLTHTPSEVQFYCIDYGGGTLQPFADAPHVGTVASRLEPDRVARVVSEVAGILARREQLFRERGIDSVSSLRTLRAAGKLPDEALGDVFLVIDGWPALRQTLEGLDAGVVDIAARGLGYGVHVIVTASRWMDIRANLKDSLRGRVELRLTDPADSVVNRRAAMNVPTGVPGRGLSPEELHFQVVLPRMDGAATTEGLGDAVQALAAAVGAAWTGPAAPPVRLLPTTLPADALPAPGSDRRPGVPIGIAETDLEPVYVDLLRGDPHFLLFGDGESGKTNLLRLLLRGLVARHTAKMVRVVVVDYRRTLLEVVPPDHLGWYCGAAPAAAEALAALRAKLTTRLPGADLSPAQLRERSWWSGPEYVVVVDDYDLVVTPAGNPLAPLVDFLAQGRDLGLHVVLSRRVAGASRAMFEPVMQRVRDLGTPGLILSGDRQEGVLLGGAKASEQPAGRGLLVQRRSAPTLVQTGLADPDQ